MDKDKILAMNPGDELSLHVAEKIMGNVTTKDDLWGYMERLIDPADDSSVWVPLTPYSEDAAAAEAVVEGMLGKGYADAIYWSGFGDGKYTEAEAICKAALLAIAEAPGACQRR